MELEKMTSREMYHLMRRHGIPPRPRAHKLDVHRTINERAYYADVLRKYAVDGKIGIILSGMDCDCTQYYREMVRDAPKGAITFQRDDERHQESLDGPETCTYTTPDKITPQHRSRDLALMAYEDGHPSTVIPVSYDELVEGGEY